ncbi:unnamed protein product, partial [Didymodactylos carnosus]
LKRTYTEPDDAMIHSVSGNLSPITTKARGSLESASSQLVDLPMNLFDKQNRIVESQSSDGKKMIVDRTTWVKKAYENMPTIYRLDAQLLIPLNPMGRTGCRGRGALIRWGPNKTIMVIITRWKKFHGQFVIADGQRMLEVMVFKDKLTGHWILPGGKILGIESPYGTVCRTFNKLAFQDEESEYSLSLQEKDMIDGVIIWKDVTYNSQGFIMQMSILREIARIHDAYFE